MLILKKFPFLLALIFFSACVSYHELSIEVLNPPTYKIPPSVQSIALLNNAKEQNATIGHRTYTKDVYNTNLRPRLISRDSIRVDSTIVNSLYNMYNLVNDSYLFNSIILEKERANPSISNLTLKPLFDNYNTDAFLILESLAYTDEKTKLYYGGYPLSEVETKVITKSFWSIYYAAKELQPYQFTVYDTLYWTDADVDRADCVLESVWENADKASKKILPYWKSVSRLYYGGISYIYKQADEAVSTGDYKTAAAIWKELHDSYKKPHKTQGKMAFNLALFFELENNLTTSKEWLKEATDIFSSCEAEFELHLCTKYLEIINRRIADQEQLNTQYVD